MCHITRIQITKMHGCKHLARQYGFGDSGFNGDLATAGGHFNQIARTDLHGGGIGLINFDIVFRHHFMQDVEMVDFGEVERPDASVVIGDRALCSDPPPAGDIDLAGVWNEMTGLPFVFAVWAVRSDFEHIEAVTTLARQA